MDVHCPQCDTLFEFDERQMRGAIATLKCSVCQHLFRIETNISLGREDHRRWMVRIVSTGDVMYCSGFTVLHRWIMEGQLHRGDEISRTGKKWVQLSEIGEFTPVFEVVESIQSLTQDARERNQTVQQFASLPPRPLMRSPSRQPAPSWAGAQVDAPLPDTGEGLSLNLSPSLGPLSADPAPSFSPSVRLPPQPESQYEPQRTRTPQSLHAQPAVPVARASVRATTPSGAHASSDSSAGESTWSIHGASEPELYRVESTPPSHGGSGLVKGVLILFVVCLIGIVGFRFAAPDQFKAIFGGEPSITPSQDVAEAQAGKKTPELALAEAPDAASAFSTALTGVEEAYLAARAARNVLHGERLTQGIVAAMSPLHGAIGTAYERATRAPSQGSSSTSPLKEAQRALDEGDSKKAYDLYYKVLDRDARNAQAFTGLGWTLIQMGRHESAAVQFKRAMSIDPGLVSAYLGLAKAERNKGNDKGAIRIYDEFLRKFPDAREANIARTQRDKLLKEIGQ